MEIQSLKQLSVRLLSLQLNSCLLLHQLDLKGWVLRRLLLSGSTASQPKRERRSTGHLRLDQLVIPKTLKTPQSAKISTPFYLDYNEEIISAQLSPLPPTPLKAKPNLNNSSLFSNLPELDAKLDDLQQILKASHEISTIAPSSVQGCQGCQCQSFVKQKINSKIGEGLAGMVRTSINFYGEKQRRGREKGGWGSRGRFQRKF